MLIMSSVNSYEYNVNTFLYMGSTLFDMFWGSICWGVWVGLRVFSFYFALFCFHDHSDNSWSF